MPGDLPRSAKWTTLGRDWRHIESFVDAQMYYYIIFLVGFILTVEIAI